MRLLHPSIQKVALALSMFRANEKAYLTAQLSGPGASIKNRAQAVMLNRGIHWMCAQFVFWVIGSCCVLLVMKDRDPIHCELFVLCSGFLEIACIRVILTLEPRASIPCSVRWFTVAALSSDLFDKQVEAFRELREAVVSSEKTGWKYLGWFQLFLSGVLSLFFSPSPLRIPFLGLSISPEYFTACVAMSCCVVWGFYSVMYKAPTNWAREVLRVCGEEDGNG